MLKTKPMLEAENARLRARITELELALEGRTSVIESIDVTMATGLPDSILSRMPQRWFSDQGKN